MWSVRMRASRERAQGLREPGYPEHISGAEGIYEERDIPRAISDYAIRALGHPRGRPDSIVLTIERLPDKVARVSLLPVTTLSCGSPEEAVGIIRDRLLGLGVSARAIGTALRLLRSGRPMRGASLMVSTTGRRMEPDRRRGVRVSRLGFEKSSYPSLCRQLSKSGINTATVREALLVASKVTSSGQVIAEICTSDDPDYTTGYLASSTTGYLRLPNIKLPGEIHGGRVFFVNEDVDVERLVRYLEREPVFARL